MGGERVATGVAIPKAAPGGPAAGGPAAASAARSEVPLGPDAGVMAIMETTRAMRHLAPDPVPEELLRTVIEAATWAPSPGNAQLARYLVVTDPATIGRLAVLWRRVIDDYRTLMASAAVDEGPEASAARIRASVDYQRDHFEDTPALILVCQDTRAALPGARSSSAAVRHLVRSVGVRRAVRLLTAWRRAGRSEGAAFYPAVENLLLAARAHGLAACLTSWHLFAEDEFKRELGIPDHVKTWALIPIGWPLRRFGPVNRRPVDEVIHRERW